MTAREEQFQATEMAKAKGLRRLRPLSGDLFPHVISATSPLVLCSIGTGPTSDTPGPCGPLRLPKPPAAL